MTAAHQPLATPDDAPVLSVVDLCVAYGGVQALDSVSLSLMPETVVALIGPNGAGKTTLFQALTAAVPVQSGRIVWRGQSLLGLPPHALAGLGLVRMAQQAAVFQHLTVQDHLQLATHPLRTQRKPRLPVHDWMDEVIDQLDLASILSTRAGELGQSLQRRVELARCLVAQPLVMLLDEPAAGQTEADWQRMVGALQGLRTRLKASVLLIEHRLQWIWPISDACWVLDQGRVIAQGSPELVRQHPAVIEAYLGEATHGWA